MKRINHLKERELIEIGIPGANPSDPVFAHENSRMRIVEQIAGEVRQLQNDLFGDVGVSLRPGVRSPPLALEPLAARDMKLRVGIGNIYQYIGVDDEH